MSPYTHPVEPITDISSYFKKDEKNFSMIFTGETLELRIPLRFKQRGALEITGENITTIGVMDLIIDGKYQTGMNLLASITIVPTEVTTMTYKGIEYLVLHLVKNDVFMDSYRVLMDSSVTYVLWSEFIADGKLPYFFNYTDLLALFANAKELTGSGIGVSRSVYEGIIAHIARDSADISKQYRLTSMKKPMKLVALSDISTAPTSTVARLNGSYFRDQGLTSALRYEVDEQQPFEDILRGIPPGMYNGSQNDGVV